MTSTLQGESVVFAACAHCGAALGPPARGAAVRCGHCRGWSLLGAGTPTALRVMRIDPRANPDAAMGALRLRTESAGLGAPRGAEARTEWTTYLAREGSVHAVVRCDESRNERQWRGFIAIPLDADPRLPLEVFERSSFEDAADTADVPPEISLDSFDAVVRQKLGEELAIEANAKGLALFDIDLHPFWGAEVCLILIPIQHVEFCLRPDLGLLQRLEPNVTGPYRASIGLHDGRLKTIDLPSIESFREIGIVAALGLGLLVGLVVVAMIGLILVVVISQ